jgi:hypothetical protein
MSITSKTVHKRISFVWTEQSRSIKVQGHIWIIQYHFRDGSLVLYKSSIYILSNKIITIKLNLKAACQDDKMIKNISIKSIPWEM